MIMNEKLGSTEILKNLTRLLLQSLYLGFVKHGTSNS